MRRRSFMASGAACLVAGCSTAMAQSTATPVIGFLRTTSHSSSLHLIAAFQHGLAGEGMNESRTHRIEYRFADGQPDQLARLVAELVSADARLIVANSISALAARKASPGTTLVFVTASDPERLGLVSSLNRPGGNVTGVLFDPTTGTLDPKRLELISALAPSGRRVGILLDANNPMLAIRRAEIERAARLLGRELTITLARNGAEIEAAFARLSAQSVAAVLIGQGPVFLGERRRLVEGAARHRIPAIYGLRQFTMAGGLMSYGASHAEAYRQAGSYVARILKGEKAGDLPVMQPTRFELLINLKTAKQQGIEISATLLAIADEVIE